MKLIMWLLGESFGRIGILARWLLYNLLFKPIGNSLGLPGIVPLGYDEMVRGTLGEICAFVLVIGFNLAIAAGIGHAASFTIETLVQAFATPHSGFPDEHLPIQLTLAVGTIAWLYLLIAKKWYTSFFKMAPPNSVALLENPIGSRGSITRDNTGISKYPPTWRFTETSWRFFALFPWQTVHFIEVGKLIASDIIITNVYS